MPDAETGSAGPSVYEEEAIRERVRQLMSRLLREGHIDTDGVRDVMRAVTGAMPPEAAVDTGQVRADFASMVGRLDSTLKSSAERAHHALDLIANRGEGPTNNDLKSALASLAQLQQDCLATSNYLAEAARGNLRQELDQLTVHAQNIGAETSARVAAMMNEFVNGVSSLYRDTAPPGLETARTVSVRLTLLASGIMAGVADALNDQARRGKSE